MTETCGFFIMILAKHNMEWYGFVQICVFAALVLLFSVQRLKAEFHEAEKYSRNIDGRKPDQSFENGTIVADRVVTCGERVYLGAVYPADTWTCNDMRIDGYRLRYWYLQKIGGKRCQDPYANNTGSNDFAALCREMMLAHGITQELWSAVVNEVSCSFIDDKRVIFRKKNGRFRWEVVPGGYGYALSIQCTALP